MPAELLNGVQLHYQSNGTGDTVVLTHGSWGDGAGWGETIDELARDFRVVTWDRRGHSRSEDGDSPGAGADDIADLVALIEHVGDGPVHAVGNSYGSVLSLKMIIRELAAQVPHARVETIEGSGHVPHFTHPVEWSASLVSFFELVPYTR